MFIRIFFLIFADEFIFMLGLLVVTSRGEAVTKREQNRKFKS